MIDVSHEMAKGLTAASEVGRSDEYQFAALNRHLVTPRLRFCTNGAARFGGATLDG